MKTFNPFWVLIGAFVIGIGILLKRAYDKFKDDPNAGYYGQNILDPKAIEEKQTTDKAQLNKTVSIKSSLVRIRDANGKGYVNVNTKQALYFTKEDGIVGEFAGTTVFGGIKYVSVRKTAQTSAMWSAKGFSAINTVYVWRDAINIK